MQYLDIIFEPVGAVVIPATSQQEGPVGERAKRAAMVVPCTQEVAYDPPPLHPAGPVWPQNSGVAISTVANPSGSIL